MTSLSPAPYDIVGKSRFWLGLGLAVMLLALAGLIVRGLNLGLDFTGGAVYRYVFPRKVAETIREEAQVSDQVRRVVRGLDLPSEPVIQLAEGKWLLIRVRVLTQEEGSRYAAALDKSLEEAFPGIRREGLEFIGSVVGGELTTAAWIGSIVGLSLVSAWIWLRYQILGAGWLFAAGALFALSHDILVLIGFTAWSGLEVNSSFIAALLTVAGYSVQDTVVIYDRIRENLKVRKGWALDRIINFSLVETLPRSINTSLTTALTLWAVILLGGLAVKSLAWTLLIGIAAGTYSSVFIAAPLVLVLQRWWERRRGEGAEAPVRRVSVATGILRGPGVTTSPSQSEVEAPKTPTPAGPSRPILRRTEPVTPHRKPRKKRKR
ncbi:MAG: protein translocase subunit SecF [Armatimonadetes bacterium]|nr:protein translocase subunit SecF [Armatimonadota bacterium]MDW8120980.1 protein translocase subunit SecF [Armatimonadota bacterium]